MTIRELADRCQVHYNTMRKWLIDNKVPKANESKNAPFVLSNKVIQKAELHFLGGNIIEEQKEETKTKKTNDLVSHLVSQIDVKDTQIVKQQEQIDHLQKLLENQQILTLKAQEKVELLESGNFATSEQHSNEKVSFWKKIFK